MTKKNILIILCALSLILAGNVLYWHLSRDVISEDAGGIREQSIIEAKNDDAVFSEPLTQSDINVQISTPHDSYTYGETIIFNTVVHNQSASNQDFTFSTTCQDGQLYVSEEPRLFNICGTAFSSLSLRDDQSVEFSYDFVLTDSSESDTEQHGQKFLQLEPGQHAVRYSWQDYDSHAISIVVEK